MHKISEPIELLIIDDDFQAITHFKSNWDQSKQKVNILHQDNITKAWNFLMAENGVTTNRPHLILLNTAIDSNLGKNLLVKIKQHASLKDIPLIIFTDNVSDSLVDFVYQNNANSFITKPSAPEGYAQLTKAIQTYWFSIVWFPSA